MIKESSQNALERYFAVCNKDISITQQAFSEARQKIKWEAFRELFVFGANVHYKNYEEEIERWNGHLIFAIDGSKLSLPNDEPLRKYFGTSGAGSTSPTAQGSLAYDILNNHIADAQIEPMSTGERTMAEKHIKQLTKMEVFEDWKELILFDRGYASFELIKKLIQSKIHYVMRVRRKFSTMIDELSHGDHEIELRQGIGKTKVRVLKFLLDNGEEETLITDIKEEKYGIQAFKALYFKRWPIETKYNEIKNKLEIENFSGKLVDNIRQDFYATMILTNLAADFFCEAQEEVEKEQKGKGNKWEYKVNVNHEIGVLKDHLIKALVEEDDKKRKEILDEVIKLLKKRLIPIRPNRTNPRIISRKARFHHNQKSNC
jgi:hypothetical protein